MTPDQQRSVELMLGRQSALHEFERSVKMGLADESFLMFLDNERDMYEVSERMIDDSLVSAKPCGDDMLLDRIILRQQVRRFLAQLVYVPSMENRWANFVSMYIDDKPINAVMLIFHIDLEVITRHLEQRYEDR